MTNNPTALISYSHDSPEHESHVLELCNRLRSRGVEATCDQFLPGAPSEGWPLWMERQIEQRDFTLMVCTETYRRRFMEDEASGIGRGVVWEARILRNLLYEDSERHGRIVPVLLDASAREFVPTVFRGNFYDVGDERGFESLLRHLLREPGAEAAALGPLGPQGARWSAFERPWLVPDALRTHFFTGREDMLALLRTQLLERKRAALSGLGGVGKTQAALEYARRHRHDYSDGVFWVNAETTSSLTNGFAEIAKALNLTIATSNDQEQILQAALTWLNGTNSWLLILDNVDDAKTVARFLPQRGEGHVLITSRESTFGRFGFRRSIHVVDLDASEALDFLLVRTGREHNNNRDELAAAVELAEHLGNLPLALEQAAAYIDETEASFADYLNAYRKRRAALLEKAGELEAHAPVSVTWAANLEAVERATDGAAEVMRMIAFLAPDAIPFEVFVNGAPLLGDPIATLLSHPDELAIAELLRPLTRYSLIRSDPSSRAFSIHRLVQEFVRATLPEPKQTGYVERIVSALDAIFPQVEYATWTQCDRLVAHVVTIAKWIESYDLRFEKAGRLLNAAGAYLSDQCRYDDAQPLFERALAIREGVLGPDHLDVAQSLSNLAVLFWRRGLYADAQPLFERALAIQERAFGPDHELVAGSLNNLAVLLSDQGHLAKAQPLHERALAIRERALGLDHRDVAASLNNLAVLLSDQGRYTEAQPLHERALTIWERALGRDHPDVAVSLNNLAEVCLKQRRYTDAHTMYERALAIKERAFGPDHPSVAWSINGLATVYHLQGRYGEAESLYERGLAIRESAVGFDHPDVAQSLVGLASLRKDQGRNAQAVSLLERALAIRERAGFPTNHPEVIEIRENLDLLRASKASGAASSVDGTP